MEIGQMFLVGFRGSDVEEGSWITRTIHEYGIGGVILFDKNIDGSKRNFNSPAELKELVTRLQQCANTPLFIGIDQEGGKVCRLKQRDGFPPCISASCLARLDQGAARREAAAMAKLLNDCGINLNFAPVVDLDINPENPIIGGYQRSYGTDPARVAALAELVVSEHHRQAVACCLKHFPGHGSSAADSHVGFVDVTESWQETELQPYMKIIKNGYSDGIMTGHLVHRGLDPSGLPATLSPEILEGLLREEMHFEGVVFSDDLQMKAIVDGWGYKQAVQKAVLAGVDVLVVGNNLDYREDVVSLGTAAIEELLHQGAIGPERIERSVRNIKLLKRKIKGECQWNSVPPPIT